MNTKKISLTILGGLVLTGAWYYKDALLGSSEAGIPVSSELPSPSSSVTSASVSSSSPEGPRKVVAVDNESVYTGTLPSGRVTKEVENNNGEKVLEMLTPEQATAKLRRNEESYLVGRGKGVWRYDVVQIPSNDPIEDDHAEKIIEVPPTVAPVEEGQDAGSSDWMFWGVFDGHRFVS
jgi:pyruvate dehydrogenase phosphatase